jgi:hypothetical protein
LKIGTAEQIKYYSLEIDGVSPVLTESTSPTLSFKDVLTYQKVNNDIYYLNNSGSFYKNEEKISEEPLEVQQETNYSLEVFQKDIFLKEGKNLYLFNQDSKSFERISENIQDFKISPDNKKMAYFTDYEIWIFFLGEQTFQPRKEVGEKTFLVRLSEKISDVFWMNSDYLVFNTGNKIKITEIDERDGLNMTDIKEIKNPQMFWSQAEKRLYILSGGTLLRSSVLLP